MENRLPNILSDTLLNRCLVPIKHILPSSLNGYLCYITNRFLLTISHILPSTLNCSIMIKEKKPASIIDKILDNNVLDSMSKKALVEYLSDSLNNLLTGRQRYGGIRTGEMEKDSYNYFKPTFDGRISKLITKQYEQTLFQNINNYHKSIRLSYNNDDFLILRGQENHGYLIHKINDEECIDMNHPMRVIISNGVITSVSECDY